jgi:two-component system LytT family response regulator
MKTIDNDLNISCIIVDDEPLARRIIRECLQKHPDITICAEYGDPFEAFKNINGLKPDVLFLDIQMPEMNGFELLEQLENPPTVIFCTAYDEYAIRAFEANAILVKDGNQLIMVTPEEIYWVKAQDDYSLLHTTKGKFLVSRTLQQLEKRFAGSSFRRIHRSALVNLHLIKEIHPWSSGRYLLIMKNGDRVESSRSGAILIKNMLL